MLLLTGTSDLVRVVTSASSDIRVHASFVDLSSGTVTPTRTNTASIATNTTTTVVGSPASSTQRNVRFMSIRNVHASVSNDVTVFHTDGTTQEDLIKVTLLAGESLVFDQIGGWTHYDVNGGTYQTLGPIATQSDMETATSLSTFVTPGNQHFHPGHPKCWGKTSVSGGTPTLNVSYNITSITDTATDQLTVTIANDFSSANYAFVCGIEAATTTLSATTTSLLYFIRNATQAAGSLIIQACEIDVGAATDPSAWHWIGCGDI